MKSTRYSWQKADFWRGLIIAIGTPVFTIGQQLIPSWTPWIAAHIGQSGALISQAALSAFAAYMLKNYFTNDTAQAIKTIEKGGGAVIEPKKY